MKLYVSYKVVNNEYDQEYADQYNWGDPGPGNLKYHDSWKYGIEKVKAYTQYENEVLKLEVTDENDTSQIFEINNITRLKAELEDGSIEDFFVSSDIIRNIHTTKDRKGIVRFYFYLNTDHNFVIMNKTAYVKEADIPKKLKEGKWVKLNLPNEVKCELMERAGSMRVGR